MNQLDDETFLAYLRRVQARVGIGSSQVTEVIEADDQDDPVPVALPSIEERASAVTLRNILTRPDAHPVVLDLLFLKRYGPEWLTWEAETLALRAPADFGNPTLTAVNITKLQALKTLHLVDTFWQSWEVFLWVTMSLNGIFPDFDVMQVPTVAQVLVAVDIANHVRDDMDWGPEIRTFIQTVYRHECLYTAMAPADFVTVDRDVVDVPVRWSRVDEQWPLVRQSGRAPTDDSPESGQLRHMLAAHEYLQEARAHMQHQLRLLDRM